VCLSFSAVLNRIFSFIRLLRSDGRLLKISIPTNDPPQELQLNFAYINNTFNVSCIDDNYYFTVMPNQNPNLPSHREVTTFKLFTV
jgi:hypothetical protein